MDLWCINTFFKIFAAFLGWQQVSAEDRIVFQTINVGGILIQ